MGKLICITSHCSNKDRITTLKANINLFKSRGYDVLLFSHLVLPESIVSLVDHFVYNIDNQVLSYPEIYQINTNVIQVDDNRVRLTRFTDTVHWAYLNQLKYIGQYCRHLNYKHYVFINYDVEITDDMIQYIEHQNYNFKGVQRIKPNKPETVPSNLFYQLCKNSLTTITKNINKEQFIDRGINNSEGYLEWLIDGLNISYKTYPVPITEYHKDEHHHNHIYHTNYNKENDYFKLFYNKLYIILYGIDRPIKFNIDGVDYIYDKNTSHKNNFKQIGYYDFKDNLVDIGHMFKDNKCHHNQIQIIKHATKY